MAYREKACTKAAYRRKSSIVILIIGLIAALAVAMAVYNLINSKILFVIGYLIAVFLCVTYIIIRINTVYATYIAADKRSIYMRRWINGFVPYAAEFPAALIREFIPAKTELIEIPIDSISDIYIGTKNYIKRTAKSAELFASDVAPFEKSKDFSVKRTVQSMDIFYVETTDGDYAFMPIINFGKKPMKSLLKHISRRNVDAEFHIFSRDYKDFRPFRAPKAENAEEEI